MLWDCNLIPILGELIGAEETGLVCNTMMASRHFQVVQIVGQECTASCPNNSNHCVPMNMGMLCTHGS